MNINITDLVKSVNGLVTLPDVFIRINRIVENPNSSTSDIAKAVGQDPSFTVRLLRVANSSFYGFSSTIDTVSKAVSIIGTSQIRSLALATSVASAFDGLPNGLVSMEHFWRHSVLCALAARSLAKRTGQIDADAVFTAGLLHDIGELIIFSRLPDKGKEVLLLVLDSADELPVHFAEHQIMGFDHAQVGGELARQWKFPPMLEECIDFHHDIKAGLRFPKEIALVHIANVIALMAEIETKNLSDVSPIDPLSWKIVGLDPLEVIEATIEEVQNEITEAEKLFVGKP